MILTDAIRLYCKQHKIKARKLSRLTGLSPATAQNFIDGELLREDKLALILHWATQNDGGTENPAEASQSDSHAATDGTASQGGRVPLFSGSKR